jgi:hypothetical protein
VGNIGFVIWCCCPLSIKRRRRDDGGERTWTELTGLNYRRSSPTPTNTSTIYATTCGGGSVSGGSVISGGKTQRRGRSAANTHASGLPQLPAQTPRSVGNSVFYCDRQDTAAATAVADDDDAESRRSIARGARRKEYRVRYENTYDAPLINFDVITE